MTPLLETPRERKLNIINLKARAITTREAKKSKLHPPPLLNLDTPGRPSGCFTKSETATTSRVVKISFTTWCPSVA